VQAGYDLLSTEGIMADAYAQILNGFSWDHVKAAFLRREDIAALSSVEQESRWLEHKVRVDEFLHTIAKMDPIFVKDNRMVEIMVEEGIDTTDIPEVRDWTGAVRGKFHREK
jgi:hypothetical protein